MKSVLTVYALLSLSAFKEYSRDLLPLVFSFALPMFFIITLGNSSGTPDSASSIKVLVVGNEGAANRAFSALTEQPLFSVRRVASADPDLVIQQQQATLVIAPSGQPNPPLALYSTRQGQSLAPLIDKLLAAPAAATTSLQPRLVAENGFDYFKFLFPATVALSLLQVSLFGTAAPIIAAREKGIYRHFAVVPMPRLALLISQLSVRLVIAILQVMLLVIVGCLFFRVRIEQPVAFGFVLLLGSATLVTYGYAIAGIFSSLNLANGFLLLLNFYCMSFGQLFNDISQGQWSWLIPTTPVGLLSDALRQVMSGLEGVYSLSTSILGLIAYLMVSAFIGVKFFRFSPKVK